MPCSAAVRTASFWQSLSSVAGLVSAKVSGSALLAGEKLQILAVRRKPFAEIIPVGRAGAALPVTGHKRVFPDQGHADDKILLLNIGSGQSGGVVRHGFL